MKIATYNIGNFEQGMPIRNQYIVNEIKKVSADIICLQEVRDIQQAEFIAAQVPYNYIFFEQCSSSKEGLCILSQFPFYQKVSLLESLNLIYISVIVDDNVIGVTNIHLPWDSAITREDQIVKAITQLHNEKWDYTFIAGDFNCSDSSNVQRYLLGECTLSNSDANPFYFDLAEAYSEFTNTRLEPTVNYRKNPRFYGNTIEKNQRFDRILFKNPYPTKLPILNNCYIWGKKVYEDIALAASDHYGVVVDIDFVR